MLVQKYIDGLGLFGLGVFAISAWGGALGAKVGLVVMLVAFILSLPQHGRPLVREPLFIFAIMLVAYLLIRIIFAAKQFPGTLEGQTEDGSKWLYLCLLPLVAWWMRGDRKIILIAFSLALLGLFIGVARHHDWAVCNGLLDHARCGYGFQEIMLGLLCSTAILGMLVFAPKLLGRRGWLKIVAFSLWLLVILVLLQGLIASQSRASWLAAMLIIPLVVAMKYRTVLRRQIEINKVKFASVVVVALGSIFAVLWLNQGVISQRIAQESEVISAIAKFEPAESIQGPSIGVRYHLALIGMQLWQERPVLGWGPSMRASQYFDKFMQGMVFNGHFHNAYIEVLLRLGIIGAVLIFGMAGLMVWSLLKNYRNDNIDSDIFFFLAGALGLLAIWSIFDFQMLRPDWRYYWLLIGGAAYSFAFSRQRAPNPTS